MNDRRPERVVACRSARSRPQVASMSIGHRWRRLRLRWIGGDCCAAHAPTHVGGARCADPTGNSIRGSSGPVERIVLALPPHAAGDCKKNLLAMLLITVEPLAAHRTQHKGSA